MSDVKAVPELPVEAARPKAVVSAAVPDGAGLSPRWLASAVVRDEPPGDARPGKLAAAVAACVKSLPRIAYTKPDQSEKYGIKYEYLSEEDIVLALKAAMPDHGLAIVPTGMKLVHREVYASKSGGRMVNYLIECSYRLMHASGEWVAVAAMGEGSDSGDKAMNKAMTAAYKYALRESFLIAGGMDPDRTPSEASARADRPAPPAAGNGHRQAPAAAAKTAPAKNGKPLDERAKDAVAHIRGKAKTHADVNAALKQAKTLGFTAEQMKAILDAAFARGASLFVAEIRAAKTIDESMAVLDRALKAKLGPTHEAAIRAAASEREEQLIEADRAANPDADAGGGEEPTPVEF